MGNPSNQMPGQTTGQKTDQQQKDKGVGKPANTETIGGKPAPTDNVRNTSGSVGGSGKSDK